MPNNTHLTQFINETFLSREAYRYDLNVGDIITEEATGFRFKVIDKVDDQNVSSGYYAYAFENQSSGQVIIAHRGAEEDDNYDTFATALVNVGTIPKAQLEDAAKFTNDVFTQSRKFPDEITHTGHSLGGYIAKIMTVITGASAVSINGANIGNSIDTLKSSLSIADNLGIPRDDYSDLLNNLTVQTNKSYIVNILSNNQNVGGESYGFDQNIVINDLGHVSKSLNDISKLVSAIRLKQYTNLLNAIKIVAKGGTGIADQVAMEKVEFIYAQLRYDVGKVLSDYEVSEIFPYAKDLHVTLELEKIDGSKEEIDLKVKDGKFYFNGEGAFLDEQNVVKLISGLMPEIEGIIDDNINNVTLSKSLTVNEIADNYQTTVSDLLSLNPNIAADSTIAAGTDLRLRENQNITKVEFGNLEYDLHISDLAIDEFQISGGRNVIVGDEGYDNTVNYQLADEGIDADLSAGSVLLGETCALLAQKCVQHF